MKNLLIAGASGMIGGLILAECLSNSEVSKVTSLVRKRSGLSHEKLEEVIIDDFTTYDKNKDIFKNIDAAYFCIGVYTGAVPRDEFREITVEYATGFGVLLKDNSPEASFCFLSGAGADREEKSRMMFAKDKGIAENYLLKMYNSNLYIFRPAYIYPVTSREEPNFTYRLSRRLYPLLKIVMPNAVVTSEHLAKAMFKIGMEGAIEHTFENKAIRKIFV